MSLTAAKCESTGKLRYTTKAKAWLVAKRTGASNRSWRKTEADRVPVHAYRCEFCGGYHVGHKGFDKEQRSRGRLR